MATTRIKDLSKTATTVNSDANLVLDGNTGGTQKISRDNFRQDTADAFVAAPGTYNLAPLNSGTGKIDAVTYRLAVTHPKVLGMPAPTRQHWQTALALLVTTTMLL
jgi:hypothetical protein